jgi:hypothetical protein
LAILTEATELPASVNVLDGFYMAGFQGDPTWPVLGDPRGHGCFHYKLSRHPIDLADRSGVKLDRGMMTSFLNVGRMDRRIRLALGIALGVSGILVSGHPNLGAGLGIAGVLLILSGICGT